MASSQSPEGGSTYLFPQQLGVRRTNEILLLDRPLKAKEAVDCGFANDII
jgi:2-(1,2-epoxy-1,2-dihydrophenyl)acetyl-CoA isomerase